MDTQKQIKGLEFVFIELTGLTTGEILALQEVNKTL
jgi:hypothetical protein